VRITIVAGFFLPVPAVRGGAMEKTWLRLAHEFVRAGHEVTIVSRRWPRWPGVETIDGVKHLRIGGADHSRSLTLNLILDFIWGVRVCLALPPGDIVITNTVALPVWLRPAKPKAGRVIAVIARMPKGQTRLYGHVDLLLSLSAAVTARITAENSRLADRIRPFPLPINWSLHAAATARSTPLVIGYIGRLNPEKGIGLLLAAASLLVARSNLPPWRLRLIGPVSIPSGGGGEVWFDALRASLASSLADNLEVIPPEYDPAQLARRYGEIDIFCYPSLAENGETFGVAVAEAMAAGCAPVVSRLACFDDLVLDGETGLNFDHTAAGAEANLASTLARLLLDAPLRRSLATRAQDYARRFDTPIVAQRLLTTLSELNAANPASAPS
jgi:glycosyltransferase involved in cell wall biosynthesis